MLNLNNPPSQPKDVDLDAVAALSTTGLIKRTGSGTATTVTTTTFTESFLDDADAATAQATLSLVPGTDVQAYSARLGEIASGFSGASNGFFIRKKTDGTGLEYATAGGSGTVTSVAVTAPSIFSVTGSPITAAGTIDLALATQTTNKVWASPNGSTGAPTFRALVAADIPDLSATYQPLDSDLTSIAALTTTTYGRSLLTQADASALRTTAGLGTISTQAASSVSITGGSITGITDLAVADGGTGASSASVARTNLGIVIGTDVQAQSPRLQDIVDGFTAATNGYFIRKNSGGTALEYAATAGSADPQFYKLVRVASTANVNISNPGTSTFDNKVLSNGDRILLKNQTTGSDNGIYVFNGSASAMTRATDFDENTEVKTGTLIFVQEGDTNGVQWWYLSSYNINVGSSNIQFTKIQTSIPTTVAEGGTGATDAAIALANLGYYTTTPIKSACRVASTTNVTISNPGTSTFDGVSISTNDRILLTGQTSGTENGIYVFNGSGVAMTRTTDADVTGEIFYGMCVVVVAGSSNAGIWQVTTSGTPTIGTNSIAFSKITSGGGGSGTVTSVAITAPSIFSVTGSPVTSSGTIDLALATQTTNKVFAAPNGSTGTPTFRALVAADIPDLSATYQPLDSDLTSIAALTTTTFGRSLLTQADASAARATIGTVIGTDVQAQNARLQDIATNLSATSGTIEKTAANTFGTYTVTTFAKTFLDDTTQGAVQTTLGLVPGTDIQSYSARLTEIVSGFAGASNGQFIRKNAGGTGLEYATVSGSGGITRSINVISTPTTAGATASTDYVYLVSGTTTLTLPTAVSNTNRYTVKRTGTNTVTIATTSAQTIDGSSSITLTVQYQSVDLISDGSNWSVI